MTVIASFGGALGGGCGGDGGPGGGTAQVGPRTWSAEQMTNAQTVVQIAVERRLPKRAAVIAMSTAIVESELTNVRYGDRDSLGLFQQRPSQGWGSVAQVLNPAYAAGTFYDRLLAVPGWATLPAGVAAQTVQASAYPDRYAPAEPAAAALVAQFWQGPDNPVPRPGPRRPPPTPRRYSAPRCPRCCARTRAPAGCHQADRPTSTPPRCRPASSSPPTRSSGRRCPTRSPSSASPTCGAPRAPTLSTAPG
ncbi:hypothetical protein [Pseudonocardia sp. T1-2H]|uniref:hypothetical protein n=1 Tax=Pseudonocardia sp. T1-2H TaxID=3128899 RepID=UPI0031017DB6